MNSQVNAFWKQKWFPWAFGVAVACIVTAVVLIIVLVPGKKKKEDSSRNMEYRHNGYDDYYNSYDNDYNGYDNGYNSYDDFDSDRDDFYDEYYGNSYDGTTSATQSVATEEAVVGYDPYDEYYGGYDEYAIEYDDENDYEYIVSQFEWLCEYGDISELEEFSDRFNNIDPSGFTVEQLNRIQVAAAKLAERIGY